MPAPRAAALLLALAAFPTVPTTAADHPAPVAQCVQSDAYKFVPYTGYAYVAGSPLPRRLTLRCTVSNGYDQHSTTQPSDTPFVVLAAVGTTSHADSITICTDAWALYDDGAVTTTSHCRSITDVG